MLDMVFQKQLLTQRVKLVELDGTANLPSYGTIVANIVMRQNTSVCFDSGQSWFVYQILRNMENCVP